MDLTRLRSLLAVRVPALSGGTTHARLPELCAQLALPPPPPEAEGSKAQRIRASWDALTDADLPRVARQYIDYFAQGAYERNELQEILWANETGTSIPKRFRREVAQALDATDLYSDARRFDDLLERLFILDDGNPFAFLGNSDNSLRGQINRHVFRNPGDWSPAELFDRLGAYDCTDRRFCLFLEGLASSEVRPDEAEQRRVVALINGPLAAAGVELRETGTDGGYPVFTVVSTGSGPAGRPKNIIFASAVKPDLRFRDAINNDIEIVSDVDKVLVYDRPIGADGLRWSDLQAWWADREGGLPDDEAKKTLYKRLRASLPPESPPQYQFFEAFFKSFRGAIPALPALLPEVWLHWDPKTVRERGANALLQFRMDFLLLLPHGRRVVIEVDGRQHFADENGRASPSKYAAMMEADRELRLAGYDVYRFGAAELDGSDHAEQRVRHFFEMLFRRYDVRPSR